MEAKAQARYVRVTPQKARRVVDLIRGKDATQASAVLQFAPQAASEPIRKVLLSAVANARVKADKRTSHITVVVGTVDTVDANTTGQSKKAATKGRTR